jgi:hypothetical protein
MRAVVRETLYRDIIGFIPVYTIVFTFGLWFGAWQLGWTWLQNLWLVIPLTAATADYIEDFCHLRYLRLHELDRHPSWFLTWLGAAMTWIKVIAFSGAGLLTLAIAIAGTVRVHEAPELYGWRGLLTLAVSIGSVTIFAVLGIWSIIYRLSTKASKGHDAVARKESQALPIT